MNAEITTQLQPEYRGLFGFNDNKIVCRECIRFAVEQHNRRSYFQKIFDFIFGTKKLEGKWFGYETSVLLKQSTEENLERFLTATYEKGLQDGANEVDDDQAQAAARNIESAALVSLDTIDRCVEQHRLHIADRLLTPHCPNPWCGAAFRDAWIPHNPICPSCAQRFCPLCLLPLRSDPAARRPHLSACPPAGPAALRDAQRRRYAASVGAYLHASVEPRLRTPLLDSLEPRLALLGLGPLLRDPALASPGQPTRLMRARQRRAWAAVRAACALAAVGLGLLPAGR
jgi:hypothetical protein